MFRWGNIQAIRHQFGDLERGVSLAILDLAQRGNRASDLAGKLFAREPKFISALAKPLTKRDRELHFYL